MVEIEGLEPPTYGLEVRCSIQLNYISILVHAIGFEPMAPCL